MDKITHLLHENPLNKEHNEGRFQSVFEGIIKQLLLPEIQRRTPSLTQEEIVGTPEAPLVNTFLVCFPDGKDPEIYILDEIFKVLRIRLNAKFTSMGFALQYGQKPEIIIDPAASSVDVLNLEFDAQQDKDKLKWPPDELRVKTLIFKREYAEMPLYLFYLPPFPSKDKYKAYVFDRVPAEIEERFLTTIKGQVQLFADILRDEAGEQPSLFPGKPTLRRVYSVEIKKQCPIFSVSHLRKGLAKHGSVKFASTEKTVNEHFDALESWHIGLKMKDLDRFLRLFAYMKSVKESHEENPNEFHIRDLGNGRLEIRQPFDKEFIRSFLPAKKSLNQHRDKKDLMKWFHDNNAPFFLPVPDAQTGEPILMKLPLYSFGEGGSGAFGRFILNTSILDSEFLDYVKINLSCLDDLYNTLEKAKAEKTYAKLRYSKFDDLPYRLYMELARRYHPQTENWTADGKFFYAKQEHRLEAIRELVGLTDQRIKDSFLSKQGKGIKFSRTVEKHAQKLINYTIAIAREAKILSGECSFDEKTSKYTLILNPLRFNYTKAKAMLDNRKESN